jgi:hypothetical protein
VGRHAPLSLRADLEHVVGDKSRLSVMVGKGGMATMPEPVALRIVNDGAGFSLLRIDKHGASVAHTWHPSLDEAKRVAAEQYGVRDDHWRES